MRPPRLTEHQSYRLNRWLDDCGIGQRSRSEVARIASENLGFTVNADDISKAAKAIGLQVDNNKQTSSILAQDIIDIREAFGLPVSDEVRRIAKRQAP